MTEAPNPNRRQFVGSLAAGAIAVGAAAVPKTLGADEIRAMRTATGPGPSVKPDDSWLRGIKGNHSQIFDMPVPAGGFPLFHVRNYVHTYKSAFDMSYPHVLAIVGMYGFSTPLAFNDAMWAKYPLGAAIQATDRATNAPAVRNVFFTAPDGGILPAEARIEIPGDSSISALQALGVRFILCNNAFNFWVGRIAAGVNRPAAEIRSELEANMLPGIIIVPAMVIAVNQAQAEGASYMYLE